MEDIDGARCRRDFEAGICADLRWLGLEWDGPVLRQSEQLPRYRAALPGLEARGLIYPCFCTRGAIAAELARMPAAPQGDDPPPYPGTCRRLSADERAARVAAGEGFALRLDVGACVQSLSGAPLYFEESGRGPRGETGQIRCSPQASGDIVLARRDLGVSYHLAVVLDDAHQGVTCVTRGEDLFDATPVQRLLQAVLALEVPRYHHHRLVRDGSGRRLAKRDQDRSLEALRAAGWSANRVRGVLLADSQQAPRVD